MTLEQDVANSAHKARLFGIECTRELPLVKLPGLAIGLVKDIFVVSAKRCRLARVAEARDLFIRVKNEVDAAGTEQKFSNYSEVVYG